MPFPPASRVLYRRNPLDRVICQLRFPPILRIEAEPPAAFQERIRSLFPNFAESSGLALEIPTPFGEQLAPNMFGQLIQPLVNKNYEFSSQDSAWKVTLTRTFIALTTTKYERWEEFKARFQAPLEALTAEYSPSYFSRIGLRYTDVIRPAVVGLAGRPWRDLLSPALIGMFCSPDVADSVDRFQSVHELRLSENSGTVRITTKLVKMPDQDDAFVIDSDYFDTSQTQLADAPVKLDSFNRQSTRFMRWAITNTLHNALEPSPLE